MDARIVGTTLPVLEVLLRPGEAVVSESGEMSWIRGDVEMTTHTQFAGGGGMFGAIKRTMGGGSLFMTEYKGARNGGLVGFATKLPGTILPVDVSQGRGYLIHRHGFLCGTSQIELGAGVQRKLGAGIFGGEGFVLQRVSGAGRAWIELSGEVITYDLQPGEMIQVIPGHIGMFEEGVQFDVTMVKGIKNIFFGADALFLATLMGPGRVWLQSLTVSGLAAALRPYLQVEAGEAGVAGGVAGSILKGLSS
jgi:uncharacterized protein (TIGR00266 family)